MRALMTASKASTNQESFDFKCPALRGGLLYRFEALHRKPLENIDHFLIRNFPEIGVVVADGNEKFVLFEMTWLMREDGEKRRLD